MTSSGRPRPATSSSTPQRWHLSKSCGSGRVVTIHIVVFIVMPLLLTSVVEKPPLAVATGQSSFEFAAICERLCIWGRGGNLCRCNAVHFVGKRRTLDLPTMRLRFDRSVDVAAAAANDEYALPGIKPDVVTFNRRTARGGDLGLRTSRRAGDGKTTDLIYLGPDRAVLDGQLEAVDDGGMSPEANGYRPDEDVRNGRRRTERQINDVEAKEGVESAVGGGDSEPEVGQPGAGSARNRPRHRRKNSHNSIGDTGSGTSVGPVINVFYRRPDYGSEAATKMTLVKSPAPSSSLLLLRHDGIVLPSQETTAK